MGTELNYGIIGCAGIGNKHAEAVQAADCAELAACSDIDGDIAASFADDYDIPDFYTDVTEMIDDASIDAVSICTPSGTHSQVTIEAADAGAHVLCEKPLDVYAQRISEMIDACENAGVVLAGVYQRRFDPEKRGAKRAIAEGELGEPVLGETAVRWFRSQPYYDSGGWRGTRDMDGGALMNQGIHNIDALQWLMGGVTEVTAYTDTLARDLDCEDTAAIALRFENGALGTIQATTATKGGTDRVTINGTQGSLVFDTRVKGDVDFQVGTGEESHYNAETESRAIEDEPHDCGTGHYGVVQDFVTAIGDGREPEVPARDARKAVDIILAAYKSAETGRSVSLDELA